MLLIKGRVYGSLTGVSYPGFVYPAFLKRVRVRYIRLGLGLGSVIGIVLELELGL